MRNYIVEVSSKTLNNLISYASENGVDFDEFEGCLQDNHIFYDTGRLKMGNIKPRKFIIIREKYINSWSSGLEMIMTDDKTLVEKWKNVFTEGIEEKEE